VRASLYRSTVLRRESLHPTAEAGTDATPGAAARPPRSKSSEKAKAVSKRNQYADLVKLRFKPKVNLAKRLELEARKVGAS
jgi:hypothetical protein